MMSRLDREKNEGNPRSSSRRRYQKRLYFRLLERVRRRVDNLHKVASWVVRNFRLVLLTEFRTSEMASPPVHGCRVINARSCRAMMTWGHYRSQQRLLDLSQRYFNVKVFLVNEAMTTKQCGECGKMNDIGGAEVFTCTRCGLLALQDIYSAKRVLQRALPYILGPKSEHERGTYNSL